MELGGSGAMELGGDDDDNAVACPLMGAPAFDWVRKPNEMAPPAAGGRDILLAIDDSDGCAAALRFVLRQLLRPKTDRLHLMHVIPEPPTSLHPAWPGLFQPPDVAEAEEAEVAATAALVERRFARPCLSAGAAFDVHALIAPENPDAIAAALAEKAAALRPALVVAARRGQSVAAELLMGSVTSALLRCCPAPLLIVPPPAPAPAPPAR
jgi:nucleotide-binding universal stress UspA family protein